MDNALKVILAKDVLQRALVSYVSFKQTIVRISLMNAGVRALDCRVIKIVEIIDDGNLPFAFGEQTVDQV